MDDQKSLREFEFTLPVGHVDPDGRLSKTVLLRKMTGHEEALLGDRKLRQNAGRLVTELLASCVKQIGDIRSVSAQLIGELCSPDRNFLLLELRKITFGNELEANYLCPACGETTHISQDLDELPVRKLNGEGPHLSITVDLADGYEDRAGEIYNQMVFRLPTGADEHRVAGISRE